MTDIAGIATAPITTIKLSTKLLLATPLWFMRHILLSMSLL